MERKRTWKRRLLALFMALLVISGSVIPSAGDLVSYAEGQASDASSAAPSGNGETRADSGATISLSAGLTSSEAGYVVSGEMMTLTITFTVPPLEAGGSYLASQITVTVPEGVTLSQGVNSSVVESTEQVGDIYIINLQSSLDAGVSHTIQIPAQTQNFVLENGEILEFPMMFTSSYQLEGEDQTRQMEAEANPSVEVKATDGWRVEKTIRTQDGQAVIDRVTDGGVEYYELTYYIDAINQSSAADGTEEDVWNRLGRLDFAVDAEGKPVFSLVDQLPSNTPAGGGATVVSVSTEGRGVLSEGTDYIVNRNDQGEAVSIAFLALDTLVENDPGQYQYVDTGAPIDTQYTVTLRYPVEPYLSDVDQDMTIWDLTNTAQLDYQLIGEEPVTKGDDAQVSLGGYREGAESSDIIVEKYLQIGDTKVKLDASAAESYGTASFGLYRTEDGDEVARNINNQTVGNPTEVDENGQVAFEDLLVGRTYYLEETAVPFGFGSIDGRVAVTILEDGTISLAGEYENVQIVDGVVQVTNTAEDIGVLEFWKYGKDASGNTSALAGAEFTLINREDPELVFTAVSDADGRVVFPAVPGGEYTLSETGLPEGSQYSLGEDRAVTIVSGQVNHPAWSDEGSTAERPVYLNESSYGYFKLIKKSQDQDSQGRDVFLEGARFGLYYDEACEDPVLDAEGAAVILTTGADGTVTSPMLPEGDYYLKELEAPDGYVLDETPHPVTVASMTTLECEILNEAKVPLLINKVGILGTNLYREELAGAVFEIYSDPEGQDLVGTVETYLDATGRSTTRIPGTASEQLLVKAGTYYYKEIEAPEGYVSDGAIHPIEVTKEETVTEVTNSSNYGQFKVRKVDAADTEKGLAGAEFEIYDNPECTGEPVGTFETGLDGWGYSPLLPAEGRTYYLKEVTAPDGYSVQIEIIKGIDRNGFGTGTGDGLTLVAEGQTELTVTNAEKVGIQIIKQDSKSGGLISGVLFGLYEDPDVAEGDADGTAALETASTGADGTCTFSDLEADTTYYVKELSTPAGYAEDHTVYEVKTNAADSQDKLVEKLVYNDRLGKIQLVKTTTMDGTAADPEFPMAGVRFSLYSCDQDGNYEEGDRITGKTGMTGGYIVTDGQGRASVDGLEPGWYMLVEESVEGYAPLSIKIQVTPGMNQNVSAGGPYDSHTEEIVNKPVMGKFSIKKVSSIQADTGIAATFDLYKEINGEYVKTDMTVSTGSDGAYASGWLEPGNYRLVETGVTGDYTIDASKNYDFTIEAGKTNTQYVEDPIENAPKGRLLIEKTASMDGTESAYEGAVFELYKAVTGDAGNDCVPGNLVGTDTTDSKGSAVFDDLDAGSYWLAERSIDHYEEKAPVSVTVSAGQNRTDLGGQTADPVKVVNMPVDGKVEIKKVDSTDQTKGVSATFKLYPAKEGQGDSQDGSNLEYSDTEAAVIRTDAATGLGSLGEDQWLTPGWYKVVEESAADGYVKDPAPKYIKIEAGKTNRDLVTDPVENDPMGRISIDKTAVFSVVGSDGTGDAGTFSRYDLTGSVFTIYQKTGDTFDPHNPGTAVAVIDLTNRSSGTSDLLAPGEYWVVETTTPDGYEPAAAVAVTVEAGKTAAATNHEDGDPSIDNKPTEWGRLRFYKFCLNDDTLVDGAQFELYVVDEENGTETVLDNGTTVKLRQVTGSISYGGDDSGILESGTAGEGSAVTTDLPEGTYYLKEVSLEKVEAQDPYNREWGWVTQWTGPITVVKGSESVVDRIDNYYIEPIEGTKQDKSQQGLPGAWFAAFESSDAAQKAYAAADGMVLHGIMEEFWNNISKPAEQAKYMQQYGAADLAVSGDNGTFTFDDLAPGRTYWIVEIAPPSGYSLPDVNDAVRQVTVEDDGTLVGDLIYQDIELGRLQVAKFTTLNGVAFPVEGVTIHVYRAVAAETGQTTGYVDDEGTYYSKRDIDEATGQAVPIATGTTDGEGLYTSVLIPSGVYIVEEDTNTLPGEVGIPDEADNEKTYRIVVVDKSLVDVNDDYARLERGSGFYNPAKYGKFFLKKVSSLDANTLVRASFKLYRQNQDGAVSDPVQVEDAEGKPVDYVITTSTDPSDPSVESIYLEPGIYYLVEQSVDGQYTVDADPIPITIRSGEITGAGDASVSSGDEPFVVQNVPQGSLTLEKLGVFGVDETPLSGVEFKLYRQTESNTTDGQLNRAGLKEEDRVATLVTGTNGQDSVSGLDAGTYWLVETGLGDQNYHYELTKDSYGEAVTIQPGQTTDLTGDAAIENPIHAGKFQLQKIFSDGTSTTATFLVERWHDGQWTDALETADGEYTRYEFTTDGASAYLSEYLEPGTYRITELRTGTGDYKLADPFEITIAAGQITRNIDGTASGVGSDGTSITVTNIKQGSLAIEKTGVFQGEEIEKLAGVTFELYKNTGNADTDLQGTPISVYVGGETVTKIVTGTDGTVTAGRIDPGDYWLVETDLGVHDDQGKYTLDGVSPISVEIRSGDTVRLTGDDAIENVTRYGRLEIQKVDFHSEALLSGARFTIHKTADCSDASLGLLTTGTDGKAVSELLPAGEYYLKETVSPDGYTASAQIHGPYTVRANAVTEASEANGTVIPNEKLFSIEITKQDSGDSSVLLDGAEFGLYDSEDDALADQASLNAGNAAEHAIDRAETKNGKAVFEGLTIGGVKGDKTASRIYYLIELKAPAGYAEDYEIHEVTISYGQDTVTEVSYPNEAMGRIRLLKVGQWNGASQNLAGAEFAFYPVSGNGVSHAADAQPAETQTTDVNGVLTTDPLPAGWYEVVETKAPDGYRASETSYWVEVENTKTNTQLYDTPVVNVPVKGNFRLEKVASDGITALPGAVFEFYKKDASGDYVLADENQPTFTVEMIGGRAVYPSAMLEPGDYMIKEVTAPTVDGIGYTVDSTPIYITIQAGATVDLTGENAVKNYPKLSVTLTKRGDEKNGSPLLSGAVFQMYSDPSLAEEYKVGDPVTTGGNGAATWTNLDAGTYYIKEISAPEGYAVTEEAKEVTVPKVTSLENLVVNFGDWENEANAGRILIRKTNMDGVQMLSGAQFNIYGQDEDGNYTVLMNKTPLETDGTGTVLSGLLPAGENGTSYRVVEVKAPDGYSLDSVFHPTEQVITVYPIHNPVYTEGGENQNVVTFRNKRQVDIGQFAPDIRKEIGDGDEDYTDGAVQAEESLLLAPYTVKFKVSGLADGSNELPADSFTVTDEDIKLYTLDHSAADSGTYVEKAADDRDYTINEVTVYPAHNGDPEEAVTAEVQYKTSLSSDQWITKASGLELDAARVVSLEGDGAAAVRIVYGNVLAGFTAEEGFEMEVTFAKREGDMIGSGIPEIRRITNTATVDWSYTYKDETGNGKVQSGSDESNEVEALIPPSNQVLPQVLLTNQITNLSEGGVFYTGQTIDFQVNVVNVQNTAGNAPEFKAPIVAIDLPAYTELDSERGFIIYQTKVVNGVVQRVELVEGRDFTVTEAETDAVIGMEGGSYVTGEAKTTRYIFEFSEDISLEPDTIAGENSKLTIAYGATLGYEKPTNLQNLYSPAYLSSGYLLPESYENPLGLSFKGYQSSTQDNDEIDDSIGMDLEYLNQPVGFTVLNETQIQLLKTVSDEPDSGFGTAQVDVYPNENVYYKLTLYNNSDTGVTTARFIDILPFNGDTYVFRSGDGSGITNRNTTIPTGQGYEEMLLESVTAEDENAAIYYYVEGDGLANSWEREKRAERTAQEELPMLYEASGNVWESAGDGYWTTEKPDDMSLVTAVGIEVNFPDGEALAPGATYEVELTMKAPGYTADKIEEYADTVMANSAALAVVREGEDSINPTRDIVEPNKVEAGLSLPVGAIGDYAWYDLNNNGLQDDGAGSEAANVEVVLYQTTVTKYGDTNFRSEETEIARTVTDGTGYYLFEDLPCNYLKNGAEEGSLDPDDYVGGTIYYYRVKFGIPGEHSAALRYGGSETEGENSRIDSNIDANGWTDYLTLRILNRETDGRDMIYGEENLDVDAGFIVAVALGDRVWLDENRDGLQSPGEPGVEGAFVKLYRLDSADDTIGEDEEPYATALTDENGEYLFEGLPQGYYVVEFDVRALTTDGYTYQYAFTEADAGGTSFTSGDDSDAVYAADESDRVRRTEVIPLFFGQDPEISQDGNKTDRTWDAGLWVYSALGGYVFEDTNYTDYQDLDTDRMDGPLPGTVVQLYRVINGVREEEPIRETTVGENGRYFFDQLAEGQYQVYFQFPEGYTAVDSPDGEKNPDTNLSDTNDSDCCVFADGDYTNGYTEIITLGYNTVDETWDAGANKLGAIGDYVWYDLDKDGIQDEGEEPVAGATVRLQYRMSNEDQWQIWPGGVTETDENGRYLFAGLPGGEDYPIQYRVVFDFDDPGTTITVTNSRANDLGGQMEALTEEEGAALDSDALGIYLSNLGYVTTTITLGYGETDLTWDAGIIETACGMGDFVWHDKNRNGIQDEGEEGIGGIPVVLETNASGDLTNEEAWTQVGETVTNENGYYRFLDLREGYYRVRFQISAPYIVTGSNQGDGAEAYVYDSDASRLTGDDWYMSRIFYLEDDQYDWTWDAGVYLESDIPTEIRTEYVTKPGGGVYTGEDTNISLWIGLGCAAAAVMAAVAVIGVKRRKVK